MAVKVRPDRDGECSPGRGGRSAGRAAGRGHSAATQAGLRLRAGLKRGLLLALDSAEC